MRRLERGDEENKERNINPKTTSSDLHFSLPRFFSSGTTKTFSRRFIGCHSRMFWLRGSRSALSESVNGVHQCCFLAANRSLEPRDPTHLEVTQTRARTLCWLRLCVHTLHILFLVHLVPFITLFPCTARSLSRVSKNGNPTSKRSENEKKKKRIVKNLTTGFDSHSKIQQSSLS